MDGCREYIRITYDRTSLLQMLLILIPLMSLLPVRAEIRTEPLNDATIYVEQLDSARVYHETWNIFTILDTSKLRGDYEKTWNYLTTLEDKCGNCKEINELKQLKQIIKNVYTKRCKP
ncbi:hypothetical protein QLX08_005890 [Tetragonisca angustula]|uniref:Uncharacterized protein n=1 Tax=Tetragonisca angustula TaxID=166442 RepID=A0AAW0ZWB9_9HYME